MTYYDPAAYQYPFSDTDSKLEKQYSYIILI